MGSGPGTLEDMVTRLPKILFLGDLDMAEELVPWLASTAGDEVEIACATRGDQRNSLSLPNAPIRYLGGVDRTETSALLRSCSSEELFIITCYWPWLLSEEDLTHVGARSLNFHPAPLPRDRGWYPHVHQIRTGSPAGVTLHQLAPEPDAGAIWAQKSVRLPFPVTAGEARTILQREIIWLFKERWWQIFRGEISAQEQVGDVSYHSKSSVASLDSLGRADMMTVEDCIRAIAARNTGDRSFLKVEGDAGPRFVHIAFSESGARPDVMSEAGRGDAPSGALADEGSSE